MPDRPTSEPSALDAAVSYKATDAGYRRIMESGLFDAAFYRSAYGVPLDQDPLLHFLNVGLAKGYLPSMTFDPAHYRLLVPECGTANPLLHYLEHDGGRKLPTLESSFGPLIERFKKSTAVAPALDLKTYRAPAYLKQIAAARSIDVAIGSATYRIEVPPPEFFFDRLRLDRPFSFARLPHGYWDTIAMQRKIAAEPELAGLSPGERHSLACRIGRLVRPPQGTFVEGFIEEISAMIPRHRGQPDFLTSVAFKGFPTPDESLFDVHVDPLVRDGRLQLLSETFSSGDRLFDATVWKRLAFSGDLAKLPSACRLHPVVLVGPDYFGDLNRRWDIAQFNHVVIPRELSHLIRRQLLEQIKAAVTHAARGSGPRPVVLMQCGGSLAYWLISQLFEWKPDVFYIDLGQGLNIWFTDVAEMPALPWMRYFKASAAPQLS